MLPTGRQHFFSIFFKNIFRPFHTLLGPQVFALIAEEETDERAGCAELALSEMEVLSRTDRQTQIHCNRRCSERLLSQQFALSHSSTRSYDPAVQETRRENDAPTDCSKQTPCCVPRPYN